MLPTYPIVDLIAQYESELEHLPRLEELGLHQDLAIETLSHPHFCHYGVQVAVLRADQLHPVISGNKWFKLKFNLVQARRQNCSELLSFGGAWSNHLHALAYLGQQLGLATVGVIRGEELDAQVNPMLQESVQRGMTLQFVSRREFRELRQDCAMLEAQGRYLIPEGGDNMLGMLGAASMMAALQTDINDFTHVLVASGTGCTFAGLRLGLPDRVQLLGVSALKGAWVQRAMVKRMAQLPVSTDNWRLSTEHHRGGFAVIDESLLSFMAEFGHNTGLELEPVYTAKTMSALFDFIQQQTIPAGSRVLFIHSGGLQGKRGFEPNPPQPGE